VPNSNTVLLNVPTAVPTGAVPPVAPSAPSEVTRAAATTEHTVTVLDDVALDEVTTSVSLSSYCQMNTMKCSPYIAQHAHVVLSEDGTVEVHSPTDVPVNAPVDVAALLEEETPLIAHGVKWEVVEEASPAVGDGAPYYRETQATFNLDEQERKWRAKVNCEPLPFVAAGVT
jgi:hypothetical protein